MSKNLKNAVKDYNILLAYLPQFIRPLLLNNRAASNRKEGNYKASMRDLDEAIKLNPNFSSSYINKGILHTDLNEFEIGEKFFDTGLSLHNDDINAHVSYGVNLLKQKRYYEGFSEYSWRLKAYNIKSLKNREQWQGQPPTAGQKLLIVMEQGYGDTIMYSRYLPLLKTQGWKILFSGPSEIVSLIGNLGIDEFVEVTQENGQWNGFDQLEEKEFDFFCYLGDLPLLFKTTAKKIPSPAGYLVPSISYTAKWLKLLGPKYKPRIGINWFGSKTFYLDNKRSMNLQEFLKCLPKEFEYVCLQKDLPKSDLEIIKKHDNIRFFGDQIENWCDTAGIIENIDLTISTCTSIINLTGALGRPGFVLLPFSPDFRWDADWYKSITQFRQEENGNWTKVLNKVRTELIEKYQQRGNKIQNDQIAIWLWEAQMNMQFNDVSTAIDRYLDILRVDPLHDKASIDLFMIYFERKQWDRALMTLEKRLEEAPNSAVCCNAAICYDMLGEKQKALKLYKQGLRYNPNEYFIYNNLSAIHRHFDEYESALQSSEQAINLNTKFAPAYSNKAVILYDLNELDQAEETLLQALSLDPNLPDANFSLSQVYLKQGRYYEGFKQYEMRLNFDTYKLGTTMDVNKKWNNENLDGKTILVIDEQGAGDTILYARYLPLLKDQGATIILATTVDVFEIMKNLGADTFYEIRKEKGKPKTFVKTNVDHHYDYYCYMASLPLYFKTTTKKIPHVEGYITVDDNRIQKWAEILGPKEKIRIGVVWSGGEEFLTDWRRSMTVTEFVKGLPADFEYVCLQKVIRKADEVTVHDYPWIKFVGNQIEDFVDTAGIIANVDLVISTCTSVLNLAGAMGKESWALLPFSPDWRWDANWYSSVKQYRQKTPYNTQDWSEVLAQVKADLQAKYLHESS